MRKHTKFPASLLDRLPNLKPQAHHDDESRDRHRTCEEQRNCCIRDWCWSNLTLEHIWALLLATVRSIVVEDWNVKNGNPQWQSTLPLGLSGRTLGLIGVGKLGSQVAKIAKLFNLRVIGWSPHLTPERAEAVGVEYIPTKSQLLQESDIVSLHIVLSASARHILSRDGLALLNPRPSSLTPQEGRSSMKRL